VKQQLLMTERYIRSMEQTLQKLKESRVVLKNLLSAIHYNPMTSQLRSVGPAPGGGSVYNESLYNNF